MHPAASILFPRLNRLLAMTALFLVVQLTAVTHELEHTFHDHDEQCVLSLHVNQLSAAPLSQPPAIQIDTTTLSATVSIVQPLLLSRLLAYTSRAPPSFSV